MRPTEQLKEEHTAIKTMLEILARVCDRLETGEAVNPEHLEQMVEFIQVFADRCHHGKEEELLFPAMTKAGIPREGGPIGVMLAEHDMGRGYVKALSEAVARYKAGGPEASSRIVGSARNYIALLTQHIDKENNILFPLADMRLSTRTQGQLVEQFEVLERERIGEGKHEELHHLLEHLKRLYVR